MDYVTRQFINLVKHFRKDLRKALSDLKSALHKQTEAIRESYQVTDDKQGPPPEVTILNNFPNSIEVHQNERDTKAERNYKRFMFLVSTLTLGAIVVYAVLVYWQYREMIKANVATQLTFREIQKQTKLIGQQLVGTMAAVIKLDFDFDNGDSAARVIVEAKNDGHVIARKVNLSFDFTKRTLNGIIRGIPQHEVFDIPILSPIPDIARHRYSVQGSKEEVDLFNSTKLVVRIEGNIQYDNGFGEPVNVPFCSEALSTAIWTGAGNSGNRGEFQPCSETRFRIEEFQRVKALAKPTPQPRHGKP